MTMPTSPVGAPDAAATAEAPPALLNRELSWLEFNRRILAEARDERNPLLERVRFLAITASNLDEFYTTRIGWLKRIALRTPDTRTPDGMTGRRAAPDHPRARATRCAAMIERTWSDALLPRSARTACRSSRTRSLPPAAQTRLTRTS